MTTLRNTPRTWPRRIALSLGAVALLAAPVSARADALPALLIPPEMPASIDAGLRDKILEAIHGGMPGYEFADGDRDKFIDPADSNRLATCWRSSLTCQLKLASLVGATKIVEVAIKDAELAADPATPRRGRAARGKPAAPLYHVAIRVYSTDTRALGWEHKNEQPLPVVQLIDALPRLIATAASSERDRGRATLDVRSAPTGASVAVDDASAGQTNLTVLVYPGTHKVEVVCPTPAAGEDDKYERSVETGAGQTQVVLITCKGATAAQIDGSQPPAAPVANTTGSGRSRLALKIVGPVLLAAGAGLVGVGAAALALNGQATDCRAVNGANVCPRQYDGALGGGIVTGIGGAALIGGAVVSYFAFRPERPAAAPRASVLPYFDGQSVGVGVALPLR